MKLIVNAIMNFVIGFAIGVAIVCGALILAQTLTGCTSKPAKPPFNPNDIYTNSPTKYDSVIRLVNSDGTYCSGAVVSDHYAVTAAHCLAGESKLYVSDVMEKKTIKVENAGTSDRVDLAVLSGDFSEFNKLPMHYHLQDMTNALSASEGRVFQCGYPEGGALACSAGQIKSRYFFQIATTSLVYPAMSGGPVVTQNLELVGVNYGVSEKLGLFSPLVEIWALFGIEVTQ